MLDGQEPDAGTDETLSAEDPEQPQEQAQDSGQDAPEEPQISDEEPAGHAGIIRLRGR